MRRREPRCICKKKSDTGISKGKEKRGEEGRGEGRGKGEGEGRQEERVPVRRINSKRHGISHIVLTKEVLLVTRIYSLYVLTAAI